MRTPVAVLLLIGAPAFAQPAAPGDKPVAPAMAAERARLHAALDRLNAEIDALKREPRSVTTDMKLRSRLADAEALARRLTELDANIRGAAPRPASTAAGSAAALDGPAELEARADILSDQARQLRGEADALSVRAARSRAHSDLRRRGDQMDRDPFMGLEASKRRTVTLGGSGAEGRGPKSGRSTPTDAPKPPGTDTTGGSASVSPRARDLLDPATLGEVRRLETTSSTNADALERAAAAVRVRAAELEKQAGALRSRARAVQP